MARIWALADANVGNAPSSFGEILPKSCAMAYVLACREVPRSVLQTAVVGV
jgi:hypothetical protein